MKHVGVTLIKITILPKESSSFRETQKEMLVTQNDSFSHLLSLYAKKSNESECCLMLESFVFHIQDGFITAFNNISDNDHLNLNINVIPDIIQTNT